MQRTAISNPYFMEAQPKERTAIKFEVGTDRTYCYGCGREVLPKIIKSKFLGTRIDISTGKEEGRTIAVCPCCNTVVQDPPAKPVQKKALKKIVFVWQCQDCTAQFRENEKLPLATSPKGHTCRVCAWCYGEVRLVEKKS